MRLDQYSMELRDDQIVWVCNIKPYITNLKKLRLKKPTKMMVRRSENNRLLFDLVPISEKTSKALKTGIVSYYACCKYTYSLFDNETECRAYFLSKLPKLKESLDKKFNNYQKIYDDNILEINNLFEALK